MLVELPLSQQMCKDSTVSVKILLYCLPVCREEVSNVSRIVGLPDGVVIDGQGVLLRRPDDHGGVQLVSDVERDLVSGNRHRDNLEKIHFGRFYQKSNIETLMVSLIPDC